MKKTLLVSLVAAAAASSAVAEASHSPDPAGSYVVALDGETAKSAAKPPSWMPLAPSLPVSVTSR